MSFLADANDLMRDRLSVKFEIPDTKEAWIDALEAAQSAYESAKRNEIQAAIDLDYFKFTDVAEKEAAITRLRTKEPSLARTPAEKLVDLEPEYMKYRRMVQDAIDDKRTAERWHSVAYQRLETLREVYKKS